MPHGPRQPGDVALSACDSEPMTMGCALLGEMFALPVTWALGIPAKRHWTPPPPVKLSVPPWLRLKKAFDSCWITTDALVFPPFKAQGAGPAPAIKAPPDMRKAEFCWTRMQLPGGTLQMSDGMSVSGTGPTPISIELCTCTRALPLTVSASAA